jgi:NadR type nicotinamide-nucleotide adenylyltransferase
MEKRTEKAEAVRRIAITGPESTGKSQLAGQLAAHFHTVWVPEFSRAYIDSLQRPYDYYDIAAIARGQLRNEEQLAGKASRLLFCDTDFIVTYIWSVFKYNKCDPWVERQINEHRYDLYLLCNTDLPWEPDALREYPEKRSELFSLFKNELEVRGLPYHIVSGTGISRLNNAISIVERIAGYQAP